MTTLAASRRAFLAGSAVAVGGLAIAGRLSVRDRELGDSSAAAGETMGLYILDLPRPPGDTGLTGFDGAKL
jgi:hypothetical protein